MHYITAIHPDGPKRTHFRTQLPATLTVFTPARVKANATRAPDDDARTLLDLLTLLLSLGRLVLLLLRLLLLSQLLLLLLVGRLTDRQTDNLVERHTASMGESAPAA